MQTVAIVNQKGGVGKTTTAVTLAHGLAMEGLRVLLVDLDAQGNCADALALDKRKSLYRWLVLDEGPDAIVTARDGLDAVTSDKATVKAQKVLAGESFAEYTLRNKLASLRDYDVTVLDTAPGAGVLQINALVAATHFLVPVSLAHLATVGAMDVLATVASLKKVGAFEGQWLGLLPTMWERTTKESHRQLQEMARRFGRMVWPPIPVDVKAREAPGHGKTLWEYAPGTRSLAGVEIKGRQRGGYWQVLRRLMREIGRA